MSIPQGNGHCLISLQAAIGNSVGQQGVNAIQQAAVNGGGAQGARTAASQLAYNRSLATRKLIVNMRAQKQIMSRVKALVAAGIPHREALESIIVGHDRLGQGQGRVAAKPERDAVASMFKDKIVRLMKNEKVDKVLSDDKYSLHWANMAESIKTGKNESNFPALVKLKHDNPEAYNAIKKYSPEILKIRDELRDDNNSQGAAIADRGDYTGGQHIDWSKASHAEKLNERGGPGLKQGLVHEMFHPQASVKARDTFIKDYKKWLDFDKIQKELESRGERLPTDPPLNPDEFLGKVFDSNTIIRRSKTGEPILEGGSTIKSAEAARLLHFKDSTAADASSQKYGYGSFYKNLLKDIDNRVNVSVTLKHLGDDASGNMEHVQNQLMNELRQKAEDTTLPEAERNKAYKDAEDISHSKWYHFLDDYSGIHEIPGRVGLARFGELSRSFIRMGRLGSAVFSNLGQTMAALIRTRYATGAEGLGGVLGSNMKFAGAFAKMMTNDPELKNMVRRVLALNDGASAEITRALSSDSSGPGGVMRAFEKHFFNLTSLTGFSNLNRQAFAHVLSTELAASKGVKFDDLNFGMKRHLNDYGISPAQWDYARTNMITKFRELDYLTYDQLPQGQVSNDARDLQYKLATMFKDSADYASVMHDARTERTLTGGTQKGTFLGELVRGSTQFMTFNLAHGQKVIMPNLRLFGQKWQNGQKLSCFGEAAAMFGGLAGMGALSYVLKQGLVNQKDVTSHINESNFPEEAGKLLMIGAGQSGLGGFFSDMLFSKTYMDQGHSSYGPLPSIFGPQGDIAATLGESLYKKIYTGKGDATDFLRFAQANAPLVNAWWLKPIINHAFMYGLEEYFRPGTMERLKQSAAQQGTPYGNPSPLTPWGAPDQLNPWTN